MLDERFGYYGYYGYDSLRPGWASIAPRRLWVERLGRDKHRASQPAAATHSIDSDWQLRLHR